MTIHCAPAWRRACLIAAGICLAAAGQAQAQFNLRIAVNNPSAFDTQQRAILDEAIDTAKALWESKILDYQSGVSLTGLDIRITGTTSGFGSASINSSTTQQGIKYSRAGAIAINTNILIPFSDYEGTGTNVIDELVAHEIGHLLGIGSLWDDNQLYINNTGRYTGAFGLAAYQAEFDSSATFIPVELAGGSGTRNSHWDQLMRSSSQEGNPADPFSLSPLTGITDAQGRDLGMELMTGAIDPDFGEPFLSNTTVQSLRDLGYVVVPEPSSAAVVIAVGVLATTRRRRRA